MFHHAQTQGRRHEKRPYAEHSTQSVSAPAARQATNASRLTPGACRRPSSLSSTLRFALRSPVSPCVCHTQTLDRNRLRSRAPLTRLWRVFFWRFPSCVGRTDTVGRESVVVAASAAYKYGLPFTGDTFPTSKVATTTHSRRIPHKEDKRTRGGWVSSCPPVLLVNPPPRPGYPWVGDTFPTSPPAIARCGGKVFPPYDFLQRGQEDKRGVGFRLSSCPPCQSVPPRPGYP